MLTLQFRKACIFMQLGQSLEHKIVQETYSNWQFCGQKLLFDKKRGMAQVGQAARRSNSNNHSLQPW